MIGVIACVAGAFLLTDQLIRLLHDITGGNHAADVATGFLVVWVPLVAMFGILAVNARRRGSRSRDLWALALLLLPLDLEPYGRASTNVALEQKINSLLPFLLQGMLLGIALLVAPILIFGVLLRHRRATRG